MSLKLLTGAMRQNGVKTYLIAQLYSAGQLDGVMSLLESVVEGFCLDETCGEAAGAN
jgi:hypothetical protein